MWHRKVMFATFIIVFYCAHKKKKKKKKKKKIKLVDKNVPLLMLTVCNSGIRHFSLLNVKFAGACGYDFVCDGRRLVRAYLRRRRGTI